MLNDLPKKKKRKKNESDPNGWQLFWRTQWECFRRAVTPYLMYLFMSLLALVCALAENELLRVVLEIACIAGGAFFNGHLCFHYGKMHYGAYVAGELHRRNRVFGIESGGDHRPEREYRFWKGILIGFYVALPSLILGIVAGAIPSESLVSGGGFAYYALVMFSGWTILPVTWFGVSETGPGLKLSPYFSLLFALLPVIVSAVLYNVGAYAERREREAKTAQAHEVEEAGKRAAEEVRRRTKK